MKKLWCAGGIVVVLIAGFCLWLKWKQDEPRRFALESLSHLHESLNSNSATDLLDSIVLPAAFQSRTPAEKIEFVSKALRDELSTEGLKILRKKGTFGPLREIFPAEAERWATQAGTKPEDCVAFKLEQSGLRTEVVLLRLSAISSPRPPGERAYRIVRCNNLAVIQTTP